MEKKAVGVIVGGGPAPGINGVISAASIRAITRGHKVFGIMQGFEIISQKGLSCMAELDIGAVARIHSEGGSILRTSRFNPKKSPEALSNIVENLKEANIGYLVTIGGDDTATSAEAVAREAGGSIAVAHVPKTIDNDLPLPSKDSTFGYQSARSAGTDIVETLMVDAKTTGRWYFVVAMGRKAGHLALGIGMSSGATLTLIPEEFPDQIPLDALADIITGSILRRMSRGRPYGVVVLAEGLAEKLQPESIPELANTEKDAHGHVRLAEVEFGSLVKSAVRNRLNDLGAPKVTIVDKDVGYELRCKDPIPFDREYTRELGYGAIEYLLNGGTGAMITRQGDELIPIPFYELMDPETGRAKIRLVDMNSTLYKIARKYMIRLSPEELEDEERLQTIAAKTSLTPEEFKKQFEPTAKKYGWD